ncbi:hypothetical protein CRI93_00020 [Longimonas halophila]|uniref:Uncharacterized protein n=1 Tax=Longimonas halophila TaxID=1469170 RepID=A0A2H3NSG2_9BACT|nr:hypothetical protein CRI93_00020 [Longimonas halophila]
MVVHTLEIQEIEHESDSGWTTGAKNTATVEIVRSDQTAASKTVESEATSSEIDSTARTLIIGSINSVNEATVAKLHGFLRDSEAL